jgi:hypothetical protein
VFKQGVIIMQEQPTVNKNSKSNFRRNVDYHLNGLPLEKQVSNWLTYKMHLGDLVKHNDFNPKKYPNENSLITDIHVGDKAILECTNPKDSTEMNDQIMVNKLDYFHRLDPKHLLFWVLIVSFANFSEFMLNKIKELNIMLVELRIHADKFSNRHIVKQLFKSKLYSLIKRLFKPTTKKTQFLGNNNLLDKYVKLSSTVTVNAYSNVKHTTLHQHSDTTTLVQDSNKILDKWELDKIIDRAKMLGLYDNYGFSN